MPALLENQYLTLSLFSERYAISVSRVQEVLEHTRITKLPCTATYLKGLIDLRGKAVPVIDLRLRFGMEEATIGKDAAIIVVESMFDGEQRVAGILADAVHEVVRIDPSQIDAAPRFGNGPSGDFLLGIGRAEVGFILLLDLDKVLLDRDGRILEGLTEGKFERALAM